MNRSSKKRPCKKEQQKQNQQEKEIRFIPTRPKKFSPNLWNEGQKEAWNDSKDNDVIFLEGPAGVGKTFTAVSIAMREIIHNDADKIVFVRPAVEAGESLGYLPGEMEDKISPYTRPLYDQIDKLDRLGLIDKSSIKIEVVALAYIQGRTFEHCTCILDEAQNCTVEQILMFLTRTGENAKMIVSGDPRQSFIDNSGLSEVCERIHDVKGVSVIEFQESDIVRHRIVEDILYRFPRRNT